MKNSETDREFFDFIKNTLDKYEEQYILGSWENYVKQRQKRKKILLWRIGTGIAASIIIGWLGVRLIPSAQFSNASESAGQVVAVVKDSLNKSLPIRQITYDNKSDQIKSDANEFASQTRSDSEAKSRDKEVSKEVGVINNFEAKSDKEESNPLASLPDKNTAVKPTDTRKAGNSLSPDNTYKGTIAAVPDSSDSSDHKSPEKQSDAQILPELDKTDLNTAQKFRFGVNVAPGVTSTSTASSFNYSGGINADYALSSAFRLSTGLQFEHLSAVNSEPSNDPSVPQGETRAELVDLDIPLNITWKFLVRKSTSYYVSGGISSVIYLSEKYANTSYTQQMVEVVEVRDGVENVTYQLENVRTTEETTEEPLNTFDFASRVNIILGFEQHLSSKLFLHVEPFIKIPVSDLATRNIKYTTGGITCKISF